MQQEAIFQSPLVDKNKEQTANRLHSGVVLAGQFLLHTFVLVILIITSLSNSYFIN